MVKDGEHGEMGRSAGACHVDNPRGQLIALSPRQDGAAGATCSAFPLCCNYLHVLDNAAPRLQRPTQPARLVYTSAHLSAARRTLSFAERESFIYRSRSLARICFSLMSGQLLVT